MFVKENPGIKKKWDVISRFGMAMIPVSVEYMESWLCHIGGKFYIPKVAVWNFCVCVCVCVCVFCFMCCYI